MIIKKLHIENYKLLRYVTFDVNPEFNVFVGENDSGKSSILEAISILISGKLSGYAFDKQLRATIFNDEVRKDYIQSIKDGKPLAPPRIIFEAYCEDGDMKYSGTNNQFGEDCCGIRVIAEISQHYSPSYRELLSNGDLSDIPVELYSVSANYFSGDPVVYKYCPIKAAFIDTTKKDYSGIVDRFVSENITSFLSEDEQTDLSTAYRKVRNEFHSNEVVLRLNESVKQNVHIADRQLSIDLKEEDPDGWKRQMAAVVDDVPFENIGFGSQNVIKIELAIKNSEDQSNVILLEEPENNLSYTNMAKLIQHVCDSERKQVFISTHSSYIANKLDLGNMYLVRNGDIRPFSLLSDDTKRYFKKLPGYDTLRIVLAEKVVLVEGPTDELIIQRAYFDKKGHLPISDGIDIIVVDSLAFKRYCDIAIILKKPVIVVTDNDGSIEKSITQKYQDYLDSEWIKIFYEENETLNTIEPSVLEVNLENGEPTESFRTAISKNGSMKNKSKTEVLDFMKAHKSEWALRVFDASVTINYPRYICDVIEKLN